MGGKVNQYTITLEAVLTPTTDTPMPVDWVVKGVVFQALYSECPNQPVMVKPVLADAANGNVVKEINLCLCG